ncbi:3-hydroxyacyl-CoA dehydrogenase NAD-binding domain-containing protein [Mesorhizobium sp. CAU 1732]|uniref:3-hydroxyacyl-CoA dehydrogenase n=1 Tax=Mesorhizobium sp. CAU 1732 TaxID=3140358 RepID=UPI0032613496
MIAAALAAGPCSIARAAVIGGGTIGTGLSFALRRARIGVTIVEADAHGCERSRHWFSKLLDHEVAAGRLTDSDRAAIREGVRWQTGLAGLSSADAVIEAVPENLSLKRSILRDLGAAAPGALLATTTASCDLRSIAEATPYPDRVVWFGLSAPAHLTSLVEVSSCEGTSARSLSQGLALARRLGKLPIALGASPGGIVDRLTQRRNAVCDAILLKGGLPWELDEAMVDFGFAIGPFEAQDLAGLDATYHRRRQGGTAGSGRRFAITDRMVEEGRIGKKAGVGWYRYPGGGGAVIDPLVEDAIREEAHFARIERRAFSQDEMRRCVLAAMVAEASAILGEGVASAAAIDLASVHGLGFPRERGGLMHWASIQQGGEAMETERIDVAAFIATRRIERAWLANAAGIDLADLDTEPASPQLRACVAGWDRRHAAMCEGYALMAVAGEEIWSTFQAQSTPS